MIITLSIKIVKMSSPWKFPPIQCDVCVYVGLCCSIGLQWTGRTPQDMGLALGTADTHYWWRTRYRHFVIVSFFSLIHLCMCMCPLSPPFPSPSLSHTLSLLFCFLIVDVWTVTFTADSKNIATGSHNGKINVYTVEDGSKSLSLDTRGKFALSTACVSDNKVDVHQYDGRV